MATTAKGAKGKALVIVESPAKAKTINKYLGNDYIVKSSVGHVRDLPKSGGAVKKKTAKQLEAEKKLSKEQKAQKALVNRMGIDPKKGWKARYEVMPGKEKVVNELKALAQQCDEIYLATDLDREGEAIAWHLREVIGGDDSKYQRVVFNEITKNAIQNAFKQPSQLDLNRVNAQQARRFLDRVVGYMVSPLLWAKIARGLSAGRVQSVALRLVVEREREIRAFVPVEYWQIHADTKNVGGQIRLEANKQNGKALKLTNKTETDAVVSVLQNNDFVVADRSEKPTQSKPSAPFITSTLQQAASTRLGYSVKKTMILAQRLYEQGFITYMRTDSTFLSNDAIAMVRGHIDTSYGVQYLPKNANFYGSKQGAQEAHEAIRPTDVAKNGSQLSTVERDAQRLYDLIWKQFVSCQMVPAKFLSVSLTVHAGTGTEQVELKARGRTLVFDGFMKVQPPAKMDDVLLPEVTVGEKLTVQKIDPSQHFTKPPARFTEASLVKELEKKGIGRPSTYAAIISTIQDRGYVKLENRRLFAEKMGDIVTSRLSESFPDIMGYDFTADFERQLDEVAEGSKDWKMTLDEFYKEFTKKLAKASDAETGMRPNAPVDVPEIACETCDLNMQIRTGSTGVFLGCTGYALPPKERCKSTKNLMATESLSIMTDDDNEDAETADLMSKKRCLSCGKAMDSYIVDGSRKLHICGDNPDCDGHLVEAGEFKIKGYDGPSIPCEKCEDQMELKTGRFGPYFACNGCDNTRKVMKNGEPSPPRMDPIHLPELRSQKHDDYYILREGAAGMFLAASKFPKIRETRPPKVTELQAIKGQLQEKFHYLLDAPTQDDDGNPTIYRWSRKQAEQYVGAEKDGKANKFALFYRNGKWVEDSK